MSYLDTISDTLTEHETTVKLFRSQCAETINTMAEVTVNALKSGNKICFCGNGGSAADSQHLATELVVRFTRNRRALAAIAFTTDTSALTACANDFGFEDVFSRQVEGLCNDGDVLIGLSTSGSSPNVVKAIESASTIGVTTFAFTGQDGRLCGELADHTLNVPSDVTARIQECHLIAGHILCDIAEAAFAE